MTLRRIAGAVLAAAIVAMASASVGPDGFRFSRPIDYGKLERQGLVAVTLDDDVYAATGDGFADVAVFDSRGRRVPCVVQKATRTGSRVVRQPCSAETVRRPEIKGRTRRLLVLNDEVPGADGLSLFTPEKNYECRVMVLGSNDLQHWTPLVDDGLIFDYSGHLDLRNRDIRLPRNNYRKFAVDVVDLTETDESLFAELTRRHFGGEKPSLARHPFRLDRIELWHDRSEAVADRELSADYSLTLSRVKEDLAARSTMVYVVGRREPLTELTLETPSQNFSRSIRVQMPRSSERGDEWVDVVQGRVTRLGFSGYRCDAQSIAVPERRGSEYRLVIHNGDDTPLTVTDVRARGNVYEAIFTAKPGERYHLEYGSPTANRPADDAAAVLAGIGTSGERPVEGRLGQEVAKPPASFSTWHAVWEEIAPFVPWVAVAVSAALVALLGWFVLRARPIGRRRW